MSKQDKVLLTCPRCGHQQMEPAIGFSAVCKKCGQYFRIQDVLKIKPERATTAPPPETRRISCFDCGAEFDVAVSAQSTMCKKCSHHIDLLDHSISTAVSKNFRTHGTFVIQPRGYVFNCEAIVGDAIIRGRFLGKLVAGRSLTIYSTAEIKGTFTAGRLIIPAANYFRWKEPIKVGAVEVAGELVANLQAENSVVVTPTGRLFGDVDTKNVVVEQGGVLVGAARVGLKTENARLSEERPSPVPNQGLTPPSGR